MCLRELIQVAQNTPNIWVEALAGVLLITPPIQAPGQNDSEHTEMFCDDVFSNWVRIIYWSTNWMCFNNCWNFNISLSSLNANHSPNGASTLENIALSMQITWRQILSADRSTYMSIYFKLCLEAPWTFESCVGALFCWQRSQVVMGWPGAASIKIKGNLCADGKWERSAWASHLGRWENERHR